MNVAYLRSMREFHSRTVSPGDSHRGQIIFEGSGACLTCHRVNGKGSYLAAALDDVGAIRSIDYIERSLLDPDVSNLPEHRFVRAVTRNGMTIIGRRLNEDTFTVQVIEENGRLCRALFKSRICRIEGHLHSLNRGLLPTNTSQIADEKTRHYGVRRYRFGL
jgi:hypothetical protein